MTVTIVYGKSPDGYLFSYDVTYSTARNGPADGQGGGSALYIGQNRNDGQYMVFEALVGYDYPSIPNTERVVTAEVSLYNLSILNTSIAQDVEWRGYGWSGSGISNSDWRTPAQLAAARLDGLTHITSAMKNKRIQASSDNLLNAMRSVTSMEHVVTTSRMRAGTTPTTDEGYAFSSSYEGGTTFDPALVYTSTPRHSLFGVMGAQAQVSDGWVYIQSDGADVPTLTLRHRSTGGTITTIATLPTGSGTNQFSPPYGAQSFALTTGPGDQLFVLSRYGPTINNLAILGYLRGAGVTWTAAAMRSTTMPTYGQTINQVVAAYHEVGGGAVMAIVGHIGSAGDSVVHNETSHVVFDANTVLTGNLNNALTRMSGYSVSAGLIPIESVSGYFNTWHNQTGTGMDLAAPAQPNVNGADTWGYFYSYGMNANLGDNKPLTEGRYVLNSSGSAFTHTSYKTLGAWGRKDAGGKVRVVPISSTSAAFISADSDGGYGLTVCVQNHNGTQAGSTEIGYVALAGEGIATMPDGPAIGSVPTWDAIYSSVENKLWIYYLSTANPREIRRTALNLTTMQATREDVLVVTTGSGNVIHGIRVQRNAPVFQDTMVSYSTVNGSTYSTGYVIDHFNANPAVTLLPKANFDASASAQFAWTFSDPNGDTQSAYQLEISRVSDGVVVFDSGKTASSTWSRTLAGSTITNGVDYRWRVKVWDSQDAASEWSAYGTFTTTAGGSVTITSPAADNPLNVITDDIPVSWSVTGTTQAAYRVWLYRGTTLVSDTGWIASTATTATVSGMLSDQTHEIRVQVRNASAVATNTASRFLTPSFSTPEVPEVTVQPNPAEGYVRIVVENPAPGQPALDIPEEGFESGIGTWQAGTNSTVGASADAHRGTGALLLTNTLNGNDPVYTRDWGNYRPIAPNTRYMARMWVKCNAVTNVTATIDWSTDAYVYISSSSFNVVVPANEWTLIQVTGTSPANAGLATYGPSMSGGVPSGRTLLLDEVTFGNASDRPDVSQNLILRRAAGTADPYEIIGSTDPDGTFRDYTATAAINYEYVVRGEA